MYTNRVHLYVITTGVILSTFIYLYIFTSNPTELGRNCADTSTALEIIDGFDLTGKYIVITGANSGIGFEAARALSLKGAHVVLACRNTQKCQDARGRIVQDKPNAIVICMIIDLKSFESVRKFADDYKSKHWPLHILILNAAVYKGRDLTENNLDTSFQVNYLSHFLLTLLLEDILVTSQPSRVIHVSSDVHRAVPYIDIDEQELTIDDLSLTEEENGRQRPLLAYAISKLCTNLFAKRLHKLWAHKGVTSFITDPGSFVATNIVQHVTDETMLDWIKREQPFAKSVEQAAATYTYLATQPGLEKFSGRYFANNCVNESSLQSRDPRLAKELWDISVDILSGGGFL